MSETPQNVRIVLGPVARQLIDGAGENRPKALDDAITTLLEGRKAGKQKPLNRPRWTPVWRPWRLRWSARPKRSGTSPIPRHWS